MRRLKYVEPRLAEISRQYANGNKARAFQSLVGLRGKLIQSKEKTLDRVLDAEIKRLDAVAKGLFNKRFKPR